MNTLRVLATTVAIAIYLLSLGSSSARAAGNGDYCGVWGRWREACDAGLRCDIRWSAGSTQIGLCVATAQSCGGKRGLRCPAGEFCDFDAGSCGASDQPGRCRAIPTLCTREFAPVCGCDDVTYGNACSASAAGVSLRAQSACPTPCRVAGCSSERCVGPDDPDISACVFRPEYACYRDATCAPQPGGACGWTQTEALEKCIADARDGA